MLLDVHVILKLPSPWTFTRADEPDIQPGIWTHPDFSGRIELDPLTALPSDRRLWGQRVLGRNLPEGGNVRQSEIMNSTNHKGWPLTLVSTAALDSSGKAVESRITMFYEFLYYGSSIAVVIPAGEVELWENQLRETVIEAMLSAEPLFRGRQVANIAELWDMTPSGPES